MASALDDVLDCHWPDRDGLALKARRELAELRRQSGLWVALGQLADQLQDRPDAPVVDLLSAFLSWVEDPDEQTVPLGEDGSGRRWQETGRGRR